SLVAGGARAYNAGLTSPLVWPDDDSTTSRSVQPLLTDGGPRGAGRQAGVPQFLGGRPMTSIAEQSTFTDRDRCQYTPRLGAWAEGTGTRFRVWSPATRRMELVLKARGEGERTVFLDRTEDGTFGGFVEGAGAGDRYRYSLDGRDPLPDPASRFQPEG